MKLIKNRKGLNKFPKIPTGLTELSVFNNKIVTLPADLWKEQGLEVLNISMNQIENLSPKIGNLVQLKMLDIGHNQISILPSEIGNLTNLDAYLYLHNNKFSSLPASIGQWAIY